MPNGRVFRLDGLAQREKMKNLPNNPMVTIGIPSYNRPDMLRRAIESALIQNYENLEVVVGDDASPDPETRKVIQSFEKVGRFRFCYFEQNVGLVKHWRRCFELARGDLWLCLSNDDWLEPDAVSKMVLGFGEGVGLVECSYFVHSPKGVHVKRMPCNGKVSGRQFIDDRLSGKSGYPTSEMFRVDLVHELGGYQEIGYAMDLMLEIDVGVAADVVYIDVPLAHHNNHHGTSSVSHPVSSMTTLIAFAELAASRYNAVIASKIKMYCIRGLYGRTIEGAVNANREQTRVGCFGLKKLGAEWRIRLAAAVLNIGAVHETLHSLRGIKRHMAGWRTGIKKEL